MDLSLYGTSNSWLSSSLYGTIWAYTVQCLSLYGPGLSLYGPGLSLYGTYNWAYTVPFWAYTVPELIRYQSLVFISKSRYFSLSLFGTSMKNWNNWCPNRSDTVNCNGLATGLVCALAAFSSGWARTRILSIIWRDSAWAYTVLPKSASTQGGNAFQNQSAAMPYSKFWRWPLEHCL